MKVKGTYFAKGMILSTLLSFCYLNASGQGFLDKMVHVWGVMITGSSHFTVDSEGSLYLTGTFEGPVYAGSEEYLLEPFDSCDSFIMKFDPQGGFLWDRLMSGSGSESIFDFEVDDNGHIYVLGNFDQTLLLDDVEIDIGNTGEYFLAKLNSDGSLNKIRRGTGNDRKFTLNTIALNSEGNLIVTGSHKGEDPFADSIPDGLEDINYFVCLMDSDFNVIWNMSASEHIATAFPDRQNNILFTGKIVSTLHLPDTIINAPQSLSSFLFPCP